MPEQEPPAAEQPEPEQPEETEAEIPPAAAEAEAEIERHTLLLQIGEPLMVQVNAELARLRAGK